MVAGGTVRDDELSLAKADRPAELAGVAGIAILLQRRGRGGIHDGLTQCVGNALVNGSGSSDPIYALIGCRRSDRGLSISLSQTTDFSLVGSL